MKKFLFLAFSIGFLAAASFGQDIEAYVEEESYEADEGPLFWTPVRFGAGEEFSVPDSANVCPLSFNIWETTNFDKLPNIFGLGIGGISSGKSIYGIVSGLAVGGKEMNGLGAGGLAAFGKNMNGIEIGGLVSAFSEKSNGMAFGGVMTETEGLSNGLFIGGIAILAKEQMNGFSLGGLFVGGKELNGVHFSSGVLFSEKVHGFAFGGLYNAAGQSDGLQFGLLNFLREPVAVELRHRFASTLNLPSNDFQIGFLNWAREIGAKSRDKGTKKKTATQKVQGKEIKEFVFQLGVINVNREGQGLQFGLLNFNRKGFLPCFPLINF